MKATSVERCPPTLAGLRQTLADPLLWLIVLGGLGLRLVVGWLMPERGPISDEAEYIAAARVLADGGGFSYYAAAPWLRPPGYLLWLAGGFWLWGPTVEPLRWLQVGLSLLLGPLVAWLAGLIDGRRIVQRLAAALTLALLPLAVIPWLVLTETLFTLLLLLAIGGLIARLQGGRLGWLLLAALALGSACLLRGLAVGFVGLVVLGLVVWSPGGWRRRLVGAALLAGVVALTIAPWTLRNWLAYRAFIPLETTAAYNLWLRAQGGRGESWMLSELVEQPDLPSRQTHALARGLALIRQEPAVYLARAGREFGDVWRLNFGAAERMMTGFSGGEVSRGWLLLSLVLDDLLYLALLPLALLGLVRARGPGRWLVLAWVGWTALSALLFFAIVRFRLPLLPLLALLAAIGLLELGALGAATGRPRRWAALALAAGLLACLALMPSLDGRAYSLAWQARPRWESAERAEQRRLAGDPVGALTVLGDSSTDVPAGAIVRALALAELGRIADAEAILGPHHADERAQVALGEVRRLAGDSAGAVRLWNQRAVDVANPLAWAWGRVNQTGPRVEVGDGLDLGLVRGLYTDERVEGRRFRWSDGRAAVRLAVTVPGRYRLSGAVRGYRPAGRPPGDLTLLVDGQAVARQPLTGEWQEIGTDLTLTRREVVVELVSSSFVTGYTDPRALGIMLDWLALQPAD